MIAAPDELIGDAAEPPFDLVDPAGICRREVHVEARMLGKPFTDRRGLMSNAVDLGIADK